MPTTRVYDFPYEDLGDQPGHSLHGGSAGTEPILAERVEEELVRVEEFVEEAGNRYLESGWHPIVSQEGVLIEGETIFQIPPGQFSMIKMYFRGSLTEVTTLSIRVNNDDTPQGHRRFFYIYGVDGIDRSVASDTTVWVVAEWGTRPNNTAWATLYNTHLNSASSMQGGGTRMAANGNNRRITHAQGEITGNRVISSIRVNALNNTINSCRVWIEGYRA